MIYSTLCLVIGFHIWFNIDMIKRIQSTVFIFQMSVMNLLFMHLASLSNLRKFTRNLKVMI